jgi:hypothetical protein
MKSKTAIVILAGLAAAGAAPANAAPPQSPMVNALAKCRAERDDAARLRCYDAAAAALTDASASGDIVVIDQEDVRKTRRSLFGFSVPKLPFFSGDDSAGEQQSEINAKIARSQALANGKWQIRLEDGAVWETTESSIYIRPPKPGNDVVIKRRALGSYMIRINGQRPLLAKRVG